MTQSARPAKEAVPPLHKRRKLAAAVREAAQKELRDVAAGLASYYPRAEDHFPLASILEDIARADRLPEWNDAVGRLIYWALRRTVKPARRKEERFQILTGRLSFLLVQGFHPHANRPPQTLNTEHDALILSASGATPLEDSTPANGTDAGMTMTEAMRVLEEWDSASLLPGQELAKRSADALRKRVQAAAKLGALRINPGQPFRRRGMQ